MYSYFLAVNSSSVQTSKDKITISVPDTEKEGSTAVILPLTRLNAYYAEGMSEASLIDWSKQFCSKTEVFLDIGAHTGTYSTSLSSYCLSVHAFEPQRSTFYALCGSVALSGKKNIVCHNFGLGSQNQVGNLTLNIISEDGGGSSLHQSSLNKNMCTETVRIKTLDSLRLENVGFIKLDVENNERQVLEGAIETLKMCRPHHILFESNKENEPLYSFIRSQDYSIVPVSGYWNMYLATIN